MSKQRCQRETTSSEFVEWNRFLKKQAVKTEPIFFYLARIAMEIRRSQQPKKRWKLKDFLLPFTLRSKQVEAYDMDASKSYWGAFLSRAANAKKDKS
jgi:hypothetical protein